MARRITSTAPPRVATRPAGGFDKELAAATTWWARERTHSEQSLIRMTETVTRFAARLTAEGVSSFVDATPALAAGFVLAPLPDGSAPEVHTQHARRTALRVLYRALRATGHDVGDPTLDVALPPRGLRVARPLTSDEVTLCRASALASRQRAASMRATAWALGEATAVSAEITAVRVADLDDAHEPRWVALPGTCRVRAREAELTDWGSLVLARRALELGWRNLGPETLLAYGGAAPSGGAKAQASVCNALRDVLDAAGLADEPDVRPASLRHWAGRTAYDAGAPIEHVANALGHRSLDATAEDIALDWQAPTRTEVTR